MVMSWIFTGLIGISLIFSVFTGSGSALAGAVPEGAQNGVTLAVSLAGSICLWSGLGKVMENAGITHKLTVLLRPVLHRLFPGTRTDELLAQHLSANICANLLGLGNAATPMGILAARRMVDPKKPHLATDQLCRLIVLNTASIQLIPANVAAVRTSLGCSTPFDILGAVWITSLCSAGIGLIAAAVLGRITKP